MCLGTLPVAVRRQPAPATPGDRPYLRPPVLPGAASRHRGRGRRERGGDRRRPPVLGERQLRAAPLGLAPERAVGAVVDLVVERRLDVVGPPGVERLLGLLAL